eukprot:9787595-Lingulodinium_polyedra.AAC.1
MANGAGVFDQSTMLGDLQIVRSGSAVHCRAMIRQHAKSVGLLDWSQASQPAHVAVAQCPEGPNPEPPLRDSCAVSLRLCCPGGSLG